MIWKLGRFPTAKELDAVVSDRPVWLSRVDGHARHAEKTQGSLEPGKYADLILVDRNIFAIDPQDLWKTKMMGTWVGGMQVYQAGR